MSLQVKIKKHAAVRPCHETATSQEASDGEL